MTGAWVDYRALQGTKKVPVATSCGVIPQGVAKVASEHAVTITEGIQTHQQVSMLTNRFKSKLWITTSTDQAKSLCTERYSYLYI